MIALLVAVSLAGPEFRAEIRDDGLCIVEVKGRTAEGGRCERDGERLTFHAPGEKPRVFGAVRETDAGRFRDFVILRGHYRTLADVPVFTEAASGARYPVSGSANGENVYRAYLASREKPGAPVAMTLLARIAPRMRRDGSGTDEALIVEKLLKLN